MIADTIFYNGQIMSMDEHNNQYEAIAVKKERIIALSSNEEITKWAGSYTEVVNLGGKVVVPGFIDAHQHLFISGFNLLYVHCNQSSIKEMVKVISQRAREAGSDEWIIGWGYDEANLKEGREPNAFDFQGINNPVFITRYCAHTAVVNKKVLQLAKITAATIVKNGEIVRNQNGDATGVLKEEAINLAKKVMPPYTKKQMKKAIELVMEHNLSYGITSVHEAGLGFFSDSLEEYHVLQEMMEENNLPVRVYAMILEKFFQEAVDMRLSPLSGNSYLKIGPVKMFADGTISGKTAAVSIPYNHSSDQEGMLMYTDKELEDKVMLAHQKGYQIAIHAIGDRAVQQVINAYEKTLKKFFRKDHRHRIEHAMVTNKGLRMKMKELEVIPVPQPALVYQAGDVYKENLHPSLVKNVFATREMMDDGLLPAGSSDFPITPCSPMLGIYAAICRKTANGNDFIQENSVSLKEALKMYTIYAARASFDEENKGSLEIGKLADMTVLPSDFMAYNPNEIKNTCIEMTIIGGKIRYSARRE
ncbi:amidohydrolase [Niallia sp. 01092]|uniref:amidohydrolase n=1 Tax=unclassified Niallia TaxID=2837522 RepID=UPI003FD1580F